MQSERRNQVTTKLRSFAQEQRSIQTRAEDLFWRQVRAGRFNGYKFKRQVPIAPYIVDFLCASARVLVEFDGRPHENEEQKAHDVRRDAFLRQQGFRVLRFTNDAFLGNPQAVMDQVLKAIGDAQALSPPRERVASGCEPGEGRFSSSFSEHAPSPAPFQGAPSPAEGGGE